MTDKVSSATEPIRQTKAYENIRDTIKETVGDDASRYGGFVDKDEAAEKAIAREMMEETGYAFEKFELVGEVAANPGVLDNYTRLYLATGGRKVAEQKLDTNEEIKVELIPLDELIELLLQNKIEQSLHANCIFYALLKLGRLKIDR